MVASVLTGAACVTLGGLLVFRALDAERREMRGLYQAAMDRLLSAWRDGVTIPPADVPAPAPTVDTLDPVVEDWLEQFDDAGRAHYGRKARDLARAGRGGPEIVAALNRLREAA